MPSFRSTLDRAIPQKGQPLSSGQIRRLLDQLGDDIDRIYSILDDVRRPEDYGAIGDGASHPARNVLNVTTLAELQAYDGGVFWFADSLDNEMDWLAIQAAAYIGGLVLWRPKAVYVLNKNLEVRNGYVSFGGGPCELWFKGMKQVVDDGSNLVDDPTFQVGDGVTSAPQWDSEATDPTGWVNTPNAPRVDIIFGGGRASFVDPPVTPSDFTGATAHFGQFGQRIRLPPGKWSFRAKVKLSEGASEGYWGGRVVGMGLFRYAPGWGGWDWPSPSYALSASVAQAFSPFEGWIGFEVETLQEEMVWLTFSGFNCDWEVQEVRVSPFLMNYAIWCHGGYSIIDPNGGVNLYDESVMSGCKIMGPATLHSPTYEGPIIDGILHKGFTIDGPRCNFVDVHIRDFYRGVTLGTQAYLNRFERCTIGYCHEGVHFQLGATNAGENLRFSSCILFNCDLAVHAEGGAEWNFVNCSIDYCRRLVKLRRGAVVNFHGQHFEYDGGKTLLYLKNVTDAFESGEIITGGTSGATGRVIRYNPP